MLRNLKCECVAEWICIADIYHNKTNTNFVICNLINNGQVWIV